MTKPFKLLTIILTAFVLFSAACADVNTTVNPTNTGDTDLPPAAVFKAQTQLSDELNVPATEIAIEAYDHKEWPDSCLGLGGAAESCLVAITPGWLIEFRVNGQIYFARTDEAGAVIRIEEQQ